MATCCAPFALPLLPKLGEPLLWGLHGPQAYRALTEIARLEGIMLASARTDLFWRTWLMKEAHASNAIEGNTATLPEVIGENAGVLSLEDFSAIRDVLQYRNAMVEGLGAIANGETLSAHFLRGVHAEMMRGHDGKKPGAFRPIQVHLGRSPGASIEEATYVPPPPTAIPELIENLFDFLARDDLNPVVQIAVAHAQFEMIHPFLDGNGRAGRLLITLFLAASETLGRPWVCLSTYFNDHREAYYEALSGVSKRGEWDAWIEFFLRGVIEHCDRKRRLLDRMTTLYEKSKVEIVDVTTSSFALTLLDYLFANPVFSVPDLMQKTRPNLSIQSVVQLVKKLENAGILTVKEPTSGRTPATYCFHSLLGLLA